VSATIPEQDARILRRLSFAEEGSTASRCNLDVLALRRAAFDGDPDAETVLDDLEAVLDDLEADEPPEAKTGWWVKKVRHGR
jgi:hypothetical protein